MKCAFDVREFPHMWNHREKKGRYWFFEIGRFYRRDLLVWKRSIRIFHPTWKKHIKNAPVNHFSFMFMRMSRLGVLQGGDILRNCILHSNGVRRKIADRDAEDLFNLRYGRNTNAINSLLTFFASSLRGQVVPDLVHSTPSQNDLIIPIFHSRNSRPHLSFPLLSPIIPPKSKLQRIFGRTLCLPSFPNNSNLSLSTLVFSPDTCDRGTTILECRLRLILNQNQTLKNVE